MALGSLRVFLCVGRCRLYGWRGRNITVLLLGVRVLRTLISAFTKWHRMLDEDYGMPLKKSPTADLALH